jgi:YggT family protein
MFIISTFLKAIASLLHMLLQTYIWIVIIAAVLTWVRPDPYNPIVQIIYKITNPAYVFVKRYIPTMVNGIDLSPIIIILGLQFIDMFLVKILYQIAHGL